MDLCVTHLIGTQCIDRAWKPLKFHWMPLHVNATTPNERSYCSVASSFFLGASVGLETVHRFAELAEALRNMGQNRDCRYLKMLVT